VRVAPGSPRFPPGAGSHLACDGEGRPRGRILLHADRGRTRGVLCRPGAR
jgi:hypothetical protein